MEIPSFLLESIVKNINSYIVDFYEERRKHNTKYFRMDEIDDFRTLAVGVFTDAMEKAQKKYESLKPFAMSKIMSAAKYDTERFKRRWYDSFTANLDIPDNLKQPGREKELEIRKQEIRISKNYPFSNIYNWFRMSSDAEIKVRYGANTTFDKVEENEIRKVEVWKNYDINDEGNERFLCAFPCIDTLSPSRVSKALELDILLEELRALKKLYDLDLDKAMTLYVDEVVDGPYFSEKKKKSKLEEDFNNPVTAIFMNEEGSERLELSVKDKENTMIARGMLESLDEKDRGLILSTIKHIVQHNCTEIEEGIYRIPLSSLHKDVYPNQKKANKHYLDEIENSFYRIANYTYEHIDERRGKQSGAINFIDNVLHVTDDKNNRYMDVALGKILYTPIINNELKRIPNKDLYKIENKLAKILIFAIQKDRIHVHKQVKQGRAMDYTSTFDYNRLLALVNFSSKTKRDRIREAKEAFLEFKEKGVFVKDVTLNPRNNIFTVEYIPVTDVEEQDLELFGFGRVDRIEDNRDVFDVKYTETS